MNSKIGKGHTGKDISESRLRHPVAELHREINRLFDAYSTHLPSLEFEPFRWMKSNGLPAIDLTQRNDAYEVTAELPGLQESDFDITLFDHTLKLKGEKKEEREEKDKDYFLSERHYGSFERTLQLPDDADISAIDASFKDGILRIVVPKSEEAKAKEKKVSVRID